MNAKIESFTGTHTFLSNGSPCTVHFRERMFSNAEAAFQFAGCTDSVTANTLVSGSANESPRKARETVKSVTRFVDGTEEEQIEVMREVLRCKFSDSSLKELLLDTEYFELVNGNDEGDTFWGVCNGEGKNMLGVILMEVRSELLKAVAEKSNPTGCTYRERGDRYALDAVNDMVTYDTMDDLLDLVTKIYEAFSCYCNHGNVLADYKPITKSGGTYNERTSTFTIDGAPVLGLQSNIREISLLTNFLDTRGEAYNDGDMSKFVPLLVQFFDVLDTLRGTLDRLEQMYPARINYAIKDFG